MPYADPEKRKAYHKRYHEQWRHREENVQKLRDKARTYQASKPKEKRQTEWREWYAKNKETYKAIRAAQRERPKEYAREIKRQYRLTPEGFQELVRLANGKCEICGVETKPHVDHCHRSGVVRGMLCRNCNTGIGYLRDRIDLLQNAIRYLRRAGHNLPTTISNLPPLRDAWPVYVWTADRRRAGSLGKTCSTCGAGFIAFRADAKYCTDLCRNNRPGKKARRLTAHP